MAEHITETKKPYATPELIYELDLETRAGTPVSSLEGDPLDLLSLETSELTGND